MKTRTLLPMTAILLISLAGFGTVWAGAENPCGGKAMGAQHGDHANRANVFVVDDPMNRNTVSFNSSAPLEDILGTSNKVTGHLYFDPYQPDKGGSGELTVPVASLTTGIPMRDEHLAGADWLNAEANPNIVFTINDVKQVRKQKITASSRSFDVIVVGDFSLNGVVRSIEVPARINFLEESEATQKRFPGDLLAARTEFEINLADFGVTGPVGMGLIGSKVGETIQIKLSLVGSNQAEVMAGNPDGDKATMAAGNPCGGKATMTAGNPCGGKAENPCGGKAEDMSTGKAGNPCGNKSHQ